MQKKLAASFLVVACLFAVVGVVVPRVHPDPVWGTALAVSLEPAGGSPTGTASGPILYVGAVLPAADSRGPQAGQ